MQAPGGQLRLANLQPNILDEFQVTRLDSVFDLPAPPCSTAVG
jgi:hypothetical protein